MSPTSQSLAKLRAEGYTAEVVEQRLPHAKTTRDLFGFVDIVAIRGAETLAVQTTSVDHISHRRSKIAESPHLAAVLAAGWTIRIHGWRPDGRLQEEDIT